MKSLYATFVNDLNMDCFVVTGTADLEYNCVYLYTLKPKEVSFVSHKVSWFYFSLLFSKKAQQCLTLVCY